MGAIYIEPWEKINIVVWFAHTMFYEFCLWGSCRKNIEPFCYWFENLILRYEQAEGVWDRWLKQSENPIERVYDCVGEETLRGEGQTSEKQFTSGP